MPQLKDHTDRNKAYRYEIARKLIHLSSLSIAIIYCHIERDLALMLLVPLFAGFFLVDLLKNSVPPIAAWYHATFGGMLREHELEKERLHFNGATYITLSALLLVLLFPKIIAITAFALVAVSDTVAALAGKRFGRHPIGDKTVEGSAAFLVSALLIITIIPRLHPAAGIVMAITATVTEAFSWRINGFKIDDNLTIPLVSALAGYLFYLGILQEQLPQLYFCP
ncbi:diacylglycerol/polyprenol kinase family protein [Prosthecochloris sp. HL-130-GSB]|jgi:dolichol kinase|uniref:Phosphatidate cytidylyltransferase n=1 Tax=Prosthecochloris aestuarii TaxID=1102 RepID=A0A831SN37_PROAE|nr:diacylglycerol/polyprenol kinase family protein [Prosthecochloris sp. HL-130-GSB]ARM30340.1 phosphatidate cytidylyltransferase [Prosthecochloris sp. HL-130-GSB]HED31572.1 phosphatidate cytidylyltransferase [Prosthecochloris aestuarii]